MTEKYGYYMMLSQIIRGLVECQVTMDVSIRKLTSDSRQVTHGAAFFAYPGYHCDGRDYIDDAVSRGAVAIFMESPDNKDEMKLRSMDGRSIPVIHIINLRSLYGIFLSRFYHDPSRQMTLVGITGTNGKSSVAYLITTSLNSLGIKAGLLGTLGIGLTGELECNDFTTPDASVIQDKLSKMRDAGAEQVVVEVSSHGLDQHRVNGCVFDTAILTNVSRDHLDYHDSQESYIESKGKLFAKSFLTNMIVNIDDQYGKELFIRYSTERRVIGYSLDKKYLDHRSVVVAHQICSSINGSSFEVRSPWGVGKVETKLLGRFNIYNLLAAITSLCLHEVAFEDAISAISHISGIPGRMEQYGGVGGSPNIFVDYAHTPDAMSKVLSLLRQHCSGRLIIVFGCGGDRDRGKRVLMGQVASQYCDEIILTDDNPRFENPKRIIDDIVLGIDNDREVEIEHDRAVAIAKAVKNALENDVILLAGKGHETSQLVAGESYEFSDCQQIQMLLRVSRLNEAM